MTLLLQVGFMFAPVVSIWFLSIAAIGLYNIFKYNATIFRALNPLYIVAYFQRNKKDAWISLGGIVLCITGTLILEPNHFSKKKKKKSSAESSGSSQNITGKLLVPFAHQEAKPWSRWLGVLDKKIV
jgi:hypothetical protein